MNNEQKQEIIMLRRFGNTYPEIEIITGYSIAAIQRVIKRNAPELSEMAIPKIPKDRRREIARAYYEDGLTAKETMKQYGCCKKVIQQIREEFGDYYGKRKLRGSRTTFSDEMLGKIREEYANGATPRELYNKYCINRSQLRLYGIGD